MKASKLVALPILSTALFVQPALATGDNTISTRLKGVQEVPSVISAAKGRFKAHIDERAGAIDFELSYSGLEGEVRQAHIHVGQRGANGGISVFLCQTAANPDPTGFAAQCVQSGTVTGVLRAANVIGPAGQGVAAMEFSALIDAIRAGVAYANVHSTKFPGGEVRGQLRDHDDD